MDEFIKREAALMKLMQDGCSAKNLQSISDMPAADVAQVVHGRWGNNGIPGSMLCGCSVCGFTCGASSFFYCPNCGSKMDGEP